MADQNQVIRVACWRLSHDFDGNFDLTSAQYATGIGATPTPPSTLLGLYQAATAKGANPAELAPFYKHSALVADMKTALATANAGDISSLIEIASNLAGVLSDAALNAVRAVLSGQRLVDAVAAEYVDENGDPIVMPGSITAGMVDTALGRI